MKNLLTLTLSVIVISVMSIQSAVAQDCSDNCRCSPPCECNGYEECGCTQVSDSRIERISEQGEELGASRYILERLFEYYGELGRSSVIRRLVNEFLWGGCLEIVPHPENARFERFWNMYGFWNDISIQDADDWTGDITKYYCISIPFYDTASFCTTFVKFNQRISKEEQVDYLRKVGYVYMQSGTPFIRQGRRVIIDYYIRKREGKETEYVAVGDGVFKGWIVKMIRPAQVFGKSME